MSHKCVDVEVLYSKDADLKRDDVRILQEWIKKEAHLPQITEMQTALFLHSCYYRIEPAKTTIENYFSLRTQGAEVFDYLDKDALIETFLVGLVTVLPELTPEGYSVLLVKLLDLKPENFNFLNEVKAINMVSVLEIHLNGYQNGAVAILDAEGFSLGHVTRISLTTFKTALHFLQEAAPARIKGIHVINITPFVDKVYSMVKPFLNKELLRLVQLHSSYVNTLYKYVPKQCLPPEYGGQQASIQVLHENNKKHVLENLDLLEWHQNQKTDEAKRTGKSKNDGAVFGTEGTFKKLDID